MRSWTFFPKKALSIEIGFVHLFHSNIIRQPTLLLTTYFSISIYCNNPNRLITLTQPYLIRIKYEW